MKKLDSVYVYPDPERAMVFDTRGEQVPEYQGRDWREALDRDGYYLVSLFGTGTRYGDATRYAIFEKGK